MKQITETECGMRVTLDTKSSPPLLLIQQGDQVIRMTPQNQDAAHAIRSNLSKMLDASARLKAEASR